MFAPCIGYILTRRRGADTAHTQMGRPTYEAPTREYYLILSYTQTHTNNYTYTTGYPSYRPFRIAALVPRVGARPWRTLLVTTIRVRHPARSACTAPAPRRMISEAGALASTPPRRLTRKYSCDTHLDALSMPAPPPARLPARAVLPVTVCTTISKATALQHSA